MEFYSARPHLAYLASVALGAALACSTTACVDDPDGRDDADAGALGTEAAALSGSRYGIERRVVGVVRAGDPRSYPALALGASRVLVHRAWTEGRSAADLTVAVSDASGRQTPHRVRWVQPLLDGTATVLVIDGDAEDIFDVERASSAAALMNREVRCTSYIFDNANQIYVQAYVTLRVSGGSDAALDLASVSGNVNVTTDLGTPCYDVRPGAVAAIGYVIDVGGVAKLRRYRALDGDVARFAPLLAHGAAAGALPVRLATQYLLGVPERGIVAVDSCLDIPDESTTPGAGVNYFPCHGDGNQRFVVESVAAGQLPRLIGFQSGLCLTAGATSGAPVTLAECSNSQVQRWRLETWPRAGSFAPTYTRLSPQSAATTCLGVRDWNRAAVRPAMAGACPAATSTASTYDTRWRLVR